MSEEIALTGGRWVTVRGVSRWQPDAPSTPTAPSIPSQRDPLLMAHAAYNRGERGSEVVAGERAYQAQRKRQQRARARAAAAKVRAERYAESGWWTRKGDLFTDGERLGPLRLAAMVADFNALDMRCVDIKRGAA